MRALPRLDQLLVVLVMMALPAAALATDYTGEVSIVGEHGTHSFRVEVADTPEAHARGLMHRTDLPADAGMLFVFDRAAEVSFWMRDTLISLDMLFIAADGRINRIHHDARPHDETQIASRGRVTHVLEINGGLAASLGIARGDRVEIRLDD